MELCPQHDLEDDIDSLLITELSVVGLPPLVQKISASMNINTVR